MSYRKVKSDLKTARMMGQVFGFNEITWPYYWIALNKVFPKRDWGRYPKGFRRKGSKQPIVWNRERFELVDSETRLLHEGVAGICRTRYLNTCLFRDKVANRHFFVNVTHFAPGAFKKGKNRQAKRRELWFKGEKVLQRVLKSQSTYPSLNFIDSNNPDETPFGGYIKGRAIQYFNRDHSLFKTFSVPGAATGFRVNRFAKLKTGFNTDHKPHMIEVQIDDFDWTVPDPKST